MVIDRFRISYRHEAEGGHYIGWSALAQSGKQYGAYVRIDGSPETWDLDDMLDKALPLITTQIRAQAEEGETDD